MKIMMKKTAWRKRTILLIINETNEKLLMTLYEEDYCVKKMKSIIDQKNCGQKMD